MNSSRVHGILPSAGGPDQGIIGFGQMIGPNLQVDGVSNGEYWSSVEIDISASDCKRHLGEREEAAICNSASHAC